MTLFFSLIDCRGGDSGLRLLFVDRSLERQRQLPLASLFFFLLTEANVSSSAGTRQGGGTSGNIWKKTDILAFRLNAESSRYTMAILAGMKCVSVWRLLNSLRFLSWKIHYSLALCQTVVERLHSGGRTRTFCLFLLLVWNRPPLFFLFTSLALL